MISCQRNQYCTEKYVVNIRSTSGFQVVFLRFITPSKIEKITDTVSRFRISVTVSQCEDNQRVASVGRKTCPKVQFPYIASFYCSSGSSRSLPPNPKPKTS